MADDRRITIIVPRETHLALKLAAAKRETTVSDILRSLIEGWLADQEPKSVGQSSVS